MTSREQKVAIIVARYISEKYKCKVQPVKFNGDTFLYIHNRKLNLLITVCNTNKGRCIKIEEISIEKPYRNKGPCTDLINSIKEVSDEYGVTLGLWCEFDNKKLFNFYSRMGFKYIETINDDWLEYN